MLRRAANECHPFGRGTRREVAKDDTRRCPRELFDGYAAVHALERGERADNRAAGEEPQQHKSGKRKGDGKAVCRRRREKSSGGMLGPHVGNSNGKAGSAPRARGGRRSVTKSSDPAEIATGGRAGWVLFSGRMKAVDLREELEVAIAGKSEDARDLRPCAAALQRLVFQRQLDALQVGRRAALRRGYLADAEDAALLQ